MSILKMIGLAAMVALTLTALLGAGSASGTTLEVSGITRNESVVLEASLKTGAGADIHVESTVGFLERTCTTSELKVATEKYTATAVGGKVSTFNFTCIEHTLRFLKPGTLTIEWIPKTTNGRVTLSEAEWEFEWWHSGSADVCKVPTGTQMGTLTGVASGHATLDVNLVSNCFSSGTVVMKGTYTITSPTGLGVSP